VIFSSVGGFLLGLLVALKPLPILVTSISLVYIYEMSIIFIVEGSDFLEIFSNVYYASMRIFMFFLCLLSSNLFYGLAEKLRCKE
jgi:hypothetical protein